MTAAQPHSGPHILDLRQIEPAELNPLLNAQIALWSSLLHWDFEPSANLVRRFVSMRALAGCVLVDGHRVGGYAYYVVEHNKALIGDLFLSDAYRTVENEDLLLAAAVEAIRIHHAVDRIESQPLLLLPAVHRIFPAGMTPRTFPRQFMLLELDGAIPLAGAPRAARITLQSWQERFQEAAARLIASAYEGHVDAEINDQYRSSGGALRFLQNIVQYPGCGRFFARASFLAREPDGRLAGMCLASLIGPRAGHLTQVCVHPKWKGKGLGRDLVEASLSALAQEGCDRVTLTVTSSNEAAVRLYQSFGFRVVRKFPALVWNF